VKVQTRTRHKPQSSFALIEDVLSWLHANLGLDRAIGFTILGRGWSSAAGIVTVSLIAKFLSSPEQGYYYTFGSLVALQIVFELGFSFVILQMATHERAHLDISADHVVSGNAVSHARLASVIQKSVKWYSAAALLMATTLLPAGFYFFRTHHSSTSSVNWQLPWCAVALAATLTFQLDPILSFLEGCGYVASVARLRLIQAAAGSLLAWLALITHHGLFAPAAMILGAAATALIWLNGKRSLLLGLLRHPPGIHRIQWGAEVWPFQWRIAISWICGYFIFQLFTPVLFAFRGPIIAGQMGMSLSLATAMQTVSISWVNTKAAPFGALISRKQYAELDRTFFRAVRQAIAVSLSGCLMIYLVCLYLNIGHFGFAQRLLSPNALAALLLSTTLNTVVFAEALYLRAHKQEKFLLNSILTSVLVGSSTYFLGRYHGATAMVTSYLILNLVVGLGLGTLTFVKYRRLWHAA
jgi:hypothetical protein